MKSICYKMLLAGSITVSVILGIVVSVLIGGFIVIFAAVSLLIFPFVIIHDMIRKENPILFFKGRREPKENENDF